MYIKFYSYIPIRASYSFDVQAGFVGLLFDLLIFLKPDFLVAANAIAYMTLFTYVCFPVVCPLTVFLVQRYTICLLDFVI